MRRRRSDYERFETKDLLHEILGTSLYIFTILVLCYLVVHYVGQRTEVVGSSMEYTLMDGDNLIVDKITYRFHEPERFDIVVFPYRYSKNTYYVKRIIGMPGETVQITEDGAILINGERLIEGYGKETIEDPGRAIEPVLLADDEYFVMGDNRNNSSDSRYEDVGSIKRDDLVGRAIFRIYPFSEWGKID